MSNNDSESYELGKAGKRRREEEEEEDRLSHLPEPILHHILSFIDTKSAVQTSVLSRAWRSVWKHVPVLNLHSHSFREYSSFQRYVENVLSHRGPYNVRKVSYIDSEDSEELDFTLFGKLIQYASSHDTQHLVINLDNVSTITQDSYSFSDLFGTISNWNLETLELRSVHVDRGFGSSGFGMLKTLVLKRCLLMSDEDEDADEVADEDVDFDPFSNFPSLKNLVMSDCEYVGGERILKISGPQLYSLKLKGLWCSEMEIVAPRLKSFSLLHNLDSLVFSKLSIPSLEHADIRINDEDEFMEDDQECAAKHLVALFQGLHNAMSLTLNSYTIEVLSNISEVLGQQASPFTRMKSLILYTDSVPYILSNYFLKGSSGMKPNVEFR